MSFHDRASGKDGRGFRFPNRLPRLRLQLFLRRIDAAETWWAVRREHMRVTRREREQRYE
jgi:hypothetical protein